MRRRIFLYVIVIFLFLTGCGADDNEENLNDNYEDAYNVFYRAVQLDKGSSIMSFGKTERGMSAICYDNIAENGKCSIWYLDDGKCLNDTGTLQLDEMKVEIPDGNVPLTLFSDGKEVLYLLASSDTEDGCEYYLCEYDVEGNELGRTDISESIEELCAASMAPGTVKAAVDQAGRIYIGNFANQNKLLILDSDKSGMCVVNFDKMTAFDMTCTGGKVYAAVRNGNTDILCMIEGDTGRYRQIAELPESMGTVLLCAGQNGKVLYGTYDKIYECDPDDKSIECIYAWTNLGFTGKNIDTFYSDENGSLYVCVKKDVDAENFPLIILKDKSIKEDEEEYSGAEVQTVEKQEIVLAGDPADVKLSQIVGQFNVSNEKYKVVIKAYDSERLLTEMVTGNGPDLVSNYAVDFRECVDKGMIEDLNYYLENSERLSSDMLFEKVLEVYTIDDILTCIPPAFYIDSLYGKASELGGQPGWTTQDFMTYVKKHQGCSVLEGSTFGDSQKMIIIINWWSQQDRWIDYSSGTAFFDCEDFRELVELASGYESMYDAAVFQETSEERWNEGKIALLNNAVVNLNDYMEIKDLMCGDMVSIGYPGENGSPVYGIGGYGGYAISSSSSNKDGAWEFIEFQILNQQGSMKTDAGIPVLKSAYQDMIDETVTYRNNMNSGDENTGGNGDKNAKGEYIVTQEDIGAFEYMIENAAFGGGRYSAVESILLEELEACFSGNRTVDDTVRIIQNRVQLYLDERQ